MSLRAPAKDSECGDERETWEDLLFRITGIDPRVCPYCGKGKMAALKSMTLNLRGQKEEPD
ncbi:MAG: hypothetical protein JRD02_02060 [Deltaproteobacteria bacterium]|nr:hypothetical protein [Deltaproteobacteria bacterium]